MTALPRARDLGELIILVPHLLGYRPEHSLVVVGLDQGKVRALGRIDLPPPGSHLLTSGQGATVEPGVLRAPAATVMAGSDSSGRPQVTTAQARELAGQVRARSELALLVAFESVRAASADTVDRVRVACEALELPIVESVRVRSGTWYRVVAGVEVDAHRLPRPADVPAVAEFVYRGYGVVGTREDLAASLGRPGVTSPRPLRPCTAFRRIPGCRRRSTPPAVPGTARGVGRDWRRPGDRSSPRSRQPTRRSSTRMRAVGRRAFWWLP